MHRHTEKRRSMMWCLSCELHYHATSLQELGALLQFLEFLATDNYIVFWHFGPRTTPRLFAYSGVSLDKMQSSSFWRYFQISPTVLFATPYFSAIVLCEWPFRSSSSISIFFPRIATDLLRFYRRVGVRPVHRPAIDRTSETTQLYTRMRISAR